MDIKNLSILGIIGFDGITKHGLQLHPDNKHLVYSMGNKVTIKNVDTGSQDFLSGHTNVITTLCISPCGKFIASGQLTHLLYKATVIVWNYEDRKIRANYEIHKGKVEDICFTCQSNYLVSLGGQDDGNIVIWDINNNMALCGAYASTEIAGNALTIARANLRDQCFLTGGNGTLKVWRIDPEARKVHGMNIKVGKLRRSINCIAVDDKDNEAYCGTSSGDIIRTRLNYDTDLNNMVPLQPPVMMGCYSKIPDKTSKEKIPTGELYSGGVTNLLLLPNKRIIVATGDGTIELIDIIDLPLSKQPIKLPSTPQIRTLKSTSVRGAVTSIASHERKTIIIGTSYCEIYHVNGVNLDTRLIVTCHVDAVYDVAFPNNYTEIFATGSKNDIRLWHLSSQKELLRISVPNFVCTSLCFSYDGKLIMSAWNDGVVRAFKPQSGNLYFAIENAHVKAVSALGLTKDSNTLITGGCDGQVRIWRISKEIQRLDALLKEHRGPITALHVAHNDEEVVSSSTDGTCVIWDILEYARKQVIIGNTMYMSARFSPNSLQILTCGTDRKIAYWETLDGSIIRQVEGSTVGPINCLDISPDGRYFVTGGNDCLVKFWEYMSADVTHIGTGHAAIITACRFSTDGALVISSSSDGAVIIWNSPIQSRNETSARSVKNAQKNSSSRKSDSKEENIGNVSERSASGMDSVRTVLHSKKDSQLCDYDPLQPARDSCRRGENEEQSRSVFQEIQSPSSKSDGALIELRKSENSEALRLSKASTCSNVRRTSARMDILRKSSSAHK